MKARDGQMRLIELPPKPRARPRVLMGLEDAGFHDVLGDCAMWKCRRCGHKTDWMPAPTKAKPPCPQCNKAAK